MITSLQKEVAYMGSYYAGIITNASYSWVLVIMRMGVFIGLRE